MTTHACSHPDCGIVEIAARGLCRKHYLQAWRADQLEQHEPRKPRQCPPDHAHDHDGCYLEHGCRCSRCRRERKNWRQRHASRMKAYGRDHRISAPKIDNVPAREHVQGLMREGFALERIARAAGVNRGIVADLVYGRRGKQKGACRFIRADYADRLLAITPEHITAGLTPSTGTTRRLQALVAIGYSETALAERLGMNVGNLSPLVIGKRDVVLSDTAARVAALYNELSLTPLIGKRADQARALARRRGWVPPLAWDDIDNDTRPSQAEGNETIIDEIAVDLAAEGGRVTLTPVERRAVVARLHALRMSDTMIAARLNASAATVRKIRLELELAAWTYEEIAEAEAARLAAQARQGRKAA